MADRFEVHAITGYALTVGSDAPSTSYWIADRENCYREVATFYSRRGSGATRRRAQAQALCARLNAEDAQARKGTGSS